MSAPTLTRGGTVVTLPHPIAASAPAMADVEQRVERRTLDGHLRVAVLSHAYAYTLEFGHAPLAAYEAVRDLWAAAVMAGEYPTFDYAAFWAEAAGVPVSVVLSPATADTPSDPTLAAFSLTLAEAGPR